MTVVLLFGFQGETILAQPIVILLIAILLIIQSFGVAAIAYTWAWLWRVPIEIAGPVALIGASCCWRIGRSSPSCYLSCISLIAHDIGLFDQNLRVAIRIRLSV